MTVKNVDSYSTPTLYSLYLEEKNWNALESTKNLLGLVLVF